jgi:succinate dehydrogenase/fumarate reductase flavoprotein subunit
MAEAVDVVVVGCGYAGAMAAIAAADAGARVLVLEKAPRPGGISICSAGGVRIAADAGPALAYLEATCGGRTPEGVLAVLARGMTGLAEDLRALAAPIGADVAFRAAPGNYPLPGTATFGFATIEAIPGFDPAAAYPDVRGGRAGALLFRVLEAAMAARPAITLCCASPVARLVVEGGAVRGVRLVSGAVRRAGAVVLAAGGFEADPAMQAQFWPGGPALSAAYAMNTGDGIRMAQAAGAALWHMAHWHGCYGFRLPGGGYPFGVRVKRLPDWQPDADGRAPEGLPVMGWILLDRDGRRFMNEYEPYVQDTGARPLSAYDPARQRFARNPAWLVTDAAGLALYPFGKPTRNDPVARHEWSADNAAEVASGLFRRADDAGALAALIGAPAGAVIAALRDWAAVCGSARDPFGRPASSLHPLAAPWFAAPVEPVVSNTQGGPVHDAEQRVCDPFGAPIPGLFAAGECGSVFGHLYLSGGNLAECLVGGRVAGTGAAARAVRAEASGGGISATQKHKGQKHMRRSG